MTQMNAKTGTDMAPYTVVINHEGETARLDCETLEEAQQVRRSFVNYGRYQEITIEHNDVAE